MDAAEEAAKDAKVQDILGLLKDYGEIPDPLPKKLRQCDDEVLKKYLKLAAKTDSIEAFMKMID